MGTILIVDDDESIRKFLSALFKKNGFETIDAADGHFAMDAFKKNKIDLIICDLVMPEKEGLETIREIKKINPDIPIIAISGGGLIDPETYLSLAKKLGAEHTFKKPLDGQKLVGAVKDLLV